MEKYNPLTTNPIIQDENSDTSHQLECGSNNDTFIDLCNDIIKLIELCDESEESYKSMMVKGNPQSEKFYSQLIANNEKQKELIMRIIDDYEKE